MPITIKLQRKKSFLQDKDYGNAEKWPVRSKSQEIAIKMQSRTKSKTLQ